MSHPASWLRFVTTLVSKQSSNLSMENPSNPGVLTHSMKLGVTCVLTLTGAVRYIQEGTGPASFNSNNVDILSGYARARLLFLYAATFIASTL